MKVEREVSPRKANEDTRLTENNDGREVRQDKLNTVCMEGVEG